MLYNRITNCALYESYTAFSCEDQYLCRLVRLNVNFPETIRYWFRNKENILRKASVSTKTDYNAHEHKILDERAGLSYVGNMTLCRCYHAVNLI